MGRPPPHVHGKEGLARVFTILAVRPAAHRRRRLRNRAKIDDLSTPRTLCTTVRCQRIAKETHGTAFPSTPALRAPEGQEPDAQAVFLEWTETRRSGRNGSARLCKLGVTGS